MKLKDMDILLIVLLIALFICVADRYYRFGVYYSVNEKVLINKVQDSWK